MFAIGKDYLENKVSVRLDDVKPTYALGYQFVDLNELFDPAINQALHEALIAFENVFQALSEKELY